MGFQDSPPPQTLTPSNIQQEEEEEELEETETLSLCDLPLYSDQSNDWDQHSTTTTASSDQDYFEFFSQELSPSASSAAFLPPQNIIFCGKLIPYKHLATPSPNRANDKKQITTNNQTSPNKTSRWRWRLTGAKCTTAAMQRRAYNSGKQVKVKWYFFLFGVSRFSPVVELSDIRKRQSRRRSSPPPPSSPVMFGFRGGDDGEVMGDRGWGLRGLIRALSCGGGRQPTVVAAGG
ncbi:uncharacterized protein LOC121764534 [Salvia splendens]|uniref:uncharacterized protein LOC121764534 n=1 Tax=Salvia splendens TaxID=180675 RepID=UPI001C267543|nr:uncharacterized protein LOC121764534 [Salvia splendens]